MKSSSFKCRPCILPAGAAKCHKFTGSAEAGKPNFFLIGHCSSIRTNVAQSPYYSYSSEALGTPEGFALPISHFIRFLRSESLASSCLGWGPHTDLRAARHTTLSESYLQVPACLREHRPWDVGLRLVPSPGLELTSWYWPELLLGASQTLSHYSGPDFVFSLPTSSLLSEEKQQVKKNFNTRVKS